MGRQDPGRAILGPIGHTFGIDYAYSVVATGVRS